MKFVPHAYQQYAIDFIKSHEESAVLLDMGLGKTVITLTAIADLLWDSFSVRKVLCIAPLRVARDTWPAEVKKWDHLSGLRISVAVGTETERRMALTRDADVCVLSIGFPQNRKKNSVFSDQEFLASGRRTWKQQGVHHCPCRPGLVTPGRLVRSHGDGRDGIGTRSRWVSRPSPERL